MSDRPGNEDFCKRIEAAIDYCRKEWDMTYSEVIGCLECCKADVLDEMRDDDNSEEDE